MSKIQVYISSVSSSQDMKKKQRRILDVLKSKGYDVEEVDIAASGTSNKEKMRRLCKDQTALPPQICKGEEYIGNYEAFDEAVEAENLDGFLKV